MATDETRHPRSRLYPLAVILPVLACLFCPVCLPAGLGILSALGVGIFVGEGLHRAVVAISLVVALASAAILTRRHRNPGPFAATVAGSVLVVVGCMSSRYQSWNTAAPHSS